MKRENSEDPPDSRNSLEKKKPSLIEPKRQRGSFFVEKKILVRSEINENGIEIEVGRRKSKVIYPKEIWERYPQTLKEILSQDLALIFTIHLPYLLDIERIDYQMPEIFNKKLIFEGFKKSLPSTALMKSKRTFELLEKFKKTKFSFLNRSNQVVDPVSIKTENKAALAFSFGKDSLLTFAICKEIGIETVPIYVEEPLAEFENYHKKILAKDFFKEFGQKILFLKNEIGNLRESGKNGWFGWELQLTQLGLVSLPLIFSNGVKYFFFANEQSCNYKFLDKDGFWCNPVYEQSVEWMIKFREIIKNLGIENLFIGSLVEPLHEIAIIKILHHRYPEIGKYQMSCGEIEVEKIENRWCQNCSKCARIYIFLLANGVDPKKVGFNVDMLDLKYKNKFSIFNGKNEKTYGYDKSLLGRDEQLLAFLLAFKRGVKGKLMEFFKKNYLKETKEREEELRKKFFGIHSTRTLPEELKDKVLKIYREELRGLS
jgi:hypothetical protein